MAATSAVALSAPVPGIVVSRRVLASARLLGELSVERGDALIELLPALAYLGYQVAHARGER
ncbi:hypothetical protein DHODJN_26290 [Methylorubrum extorquens]